MHSLVPILLLKREREIIAGVNAIITRLGGTPRPGGLAKGSFSRYSCQEVLAPVLPPDASITFLTAAIGPLVIGVIVGIIVKSALKIGLALVALALALIILGFLTPDQVITPLLSFLRSGTALATKVKQVAGFLPYSSVTFLLGVGIGFWKG